MKSIRQLLRRPNRTIAGIVLVALAVAVLTVGAGQGISAFRTREALERQFNTVALPTKKYNVTEYQIGDLTIESTSMEVPEAVAGWIDRTIEAHPELVELDSRPGLISAYIPELTPDNETRHTYYARSVGGPHSNGAFAPRPAQPYTRAMLEIELTGLGEPEENIANVLQEDGTTEERFMGCTVSMTGEIRGVVLLQSGFTDPTGWAIDLDLIVSNASMLDAMQLEVGRRYLVYGTNYTDLEWELCGEIMWQTNYDVQIGSFDPDRLYHYGAGQIEVNKQTRPDHYAVASYFHENRYLELTEAQLRKIHRVSLSLRTRDPTIALLTGTAEEFLASEDGAAWREKLEEGEIDNHAFPVIGVDELGYIGPFAQETARVAEGRDFTEEELGNGAQVCVMAQSLAEANGLAVGDTIELRYYNFDPGDSVSSGLGTTAPAAYPYSLAASFAGEAEEYTIVGLYRYSGEWGDPQKDLYSFTPNTIFVPKSSVTGTMDYGDQAFFRTIVLENGRIPEFRRLVDDAGYEGLFVYYDQGYSELSAAFHDYEAAAGRAALTGVAAYGAIFLLFLLLFPARQGKTLATMASLGAGWGRRYLHVAVSSIAVLIPGAIVGTITGALLWRRASDALLASVETAVSVEADGVSVLLAAAIQLVFSLCLIAVLALPMSAGRGLRKRKRGRERP